MAKKTSGFKKAVSTAKRGPKDSKPTGKKTKAQGGTAHKMSKPEGAKGKLKGSMSKGKSWMMRSSNQPKIKK